MSKTISERKKETLETKYMNRSILIQFNKEFCESNLSEEFVNELKNLDLNYTIRNEFCISIYVPKLCDIHRLILIIQEMLNSEEVYNISVMAIPDII